MLYHVEGTVTDIDVNLVVIDCHGIGFALNASQNTIASVTKGNTAKLYICESVREDAYELFGFASREEKRCFEMLISISGVGPKAAIAILSTCTPGALAMAVLNDDVKTLTRAPGIGKKIAQRIVLELKDKLVKEQSGMDFGMPAPAEVPIMEENSARSDAISALMVLGYNMPDINRALQKFSTEGLSAEQIIKNALRAMMQ